VVNKAVTGRRSPRNNLITLLWVAALLVLWPGAVPAGHPPASTFSLWPEPRPLPDLQFMDAAGKRHTLGDFRGRLVLLNVWATWCPPCREEMPALDRLQQQLGGPEFTVLALSIDSGGLAEVEAFYAQSELETLGIYLDSEGDASDQLRVFGLPSTLLIDRQGREIGRRVGPVAWDAEAVVAELRHYLDDPPGDGAPAAPPAAATRKPE
jgi:thiol-disulfide isomerase/thioredoxin